jgi:hypothetical protein
MLTPTDIADYGDRHVERWLTEREYHCHHSNVQRQGVKDLEVRSAEENLLVHIETSLAPKAPRELTHAESDSVCARAMMLGFEPWLAQVQIDTQGDLVGEIVWTKLRGTTNV